ncbi:hypothetical protein [Actinoplanes sp. NPDC051859]|uniref:hypothetical protein n=1 Tax=Actinoplanes sp. NPDC051859 TaxID=3363909 RepID=UPI0037AE735A
MIDVPPAAPTATIPDWDPGPRKPRWTPAYLAVALLLVIAGAAFGVRGFSDMFGSPRTARAAACPALDLAPLAAALGPLRLSDEPDAPTEGKGGTTVSCTFQTVSDESFPKIRGTLFMTWYDWKLMARQQCDNLADSNEPGATPGVWISGLGDRARTESSRPERLDVRFLELVVCDANAVLRVFLMLPVDEGPDDPKVHAVLTEVARTALGRFA